MTGNGWQAAGVFVSLAALGLSGGSLYLAVQNDDRLDRQERQQVASKVTLSEAPMYAYKVHPPSRSGATQWVVVNGSADPIDDVWVEGQGGRSVKMFQVQACTMYAVPPGFVPLAVNFRDAQGRWRRTASPSPPTLDGKALPAKDTDDSPWFLDAQGCA